MSSFSFFRRSLGQDDVDRYNNTWAVLLFLMLALLSLLMPLSPTLNDSVKGGSASAAIPVPSPSAKPRELSPKVTATCWTPAEFTSQFTKYANEYCADVANGLLNGVKSTRTLYELTDTADSIDELNLTSIAESRKAYFENVEAQKEQQKKNEEVRKSTRELVDFRTPVILFLLALFLKLPYILWSLISNTMTACLNIDQTLESCAESRSLDVAGQKQVHEETATAVADSVKQSKNTAAFLYLFLKVLVLLVVMGEMFFISKFIVPDIRNMEMDFVEKLLLGKEANQDAQQQNVSVVMEDPTISLFDYPNNILRCGFKIRHFKNIQKFIVQCMFTRVDGQAGSDAPMDGAASHAMVPSTPATIQSTLLLYEALFTVVIAFLALLVIANVLNTVSWFLRLFIGSYAKSMGLPGDSPRDVVLLVQMAWLNVGPRVARGLAGNSAWSSGSQQENEAQPMLETKA